jgi:deoxyribonuclease IV
VVVETPSELDGSPSAGHARDIALLCALRDGVVLESSAA